MSLRGRKMSIKLAAAIAVLVAAQGAWAQSPAPVTAPADRPTVTAGDTSSTRAAMTHRFGSRKAGTQVQIATLAREDMEARRAAMYKQADEKAAKEAQAAMDAKTGQTAPAPSTALPSPKP